MRRLILSLGAFVLVVGPAEAQDDKTREEALALIERAVRAHGGTEALSRLRVEKLKFKGTIVLKGHTMSYLAEATMQLPSKYKRVIETNNGGDKHTLVYVLNGNKLSIVLDGRAVQADPAQLAEIRSGLELERAKRLLPLLEDRSYQLAIAEEIKVNDRPAVGVRISGRGRKEMRLYFDKQFGLLVRAENRIDDGKGKEIRQHFFFDEFKQIGGYKRATKMRTYRDGKEIMTAELLDAKILEKVDETEFAKP